MREFEVNDFVVVVEAPERASQILGSLGFLINIGGIGVEEDDVAVKDMNTGQLMALKESQIRKFHIWWEPFNTNMDSSFAVHMLIETLVLHTHISFKIDNKLQFEKFRILTDQTIEQRIRERYAKDAQFKNLIDLFLRMIVDQTERTNIASFWWGIVWTSMIWLDE